MCVCVQVWVGVWVGVGVSVSMYVCVSEGGCEGVVTSLSHQTSMLCSLLFKCCTP